LIQLVRCPIWVSFVRVYLAELFEKSGISESSKQGIEAMRSPLFPMMEWLSTIAVLSDREIIEMMGVVAKTERRVPDSLWVVSFLDNLQDKGVVVGTTGRYGYCFQMISSLLFVM